MTHLAQSLKNFKAFPQNGLAVFAGIVNDSYWSAALEPSRAITHYLYRCGNELYLEPLERLEARADLVAVIALDANDCAIGVLDGAGWEILDEMTSGIPGKTGKGGQSQRRYERNREIALNSFYKRIAEHANNLLLSMPRLKEVFVMGPGFTKNLFLRSGKLDYRLRKMVARVIDNAYAGADGVLQAHNILIAEASEGASESSKA